MLIGHLGNYREANLSVKAEAGYWRMRLGKHDVRGNEIPGEDSSTVRAEYGTPLRLTIDARVQRIAEEALDSRIEALELGREEGDRPICGAVVIVDPNNGDVLAAASAPRYNLNGFYKNYNSFLKNKRHPLFHVPARAASAFGYAGRASIFSYTASVSSAADS